MKKNIKVGISLFHPFTMKLNNKLYGFEVELFEFICKDLKLKPIYSESSIENIISDLKKSKLDIGLGAFSATERKEKIVDFSHSILSSHFSIAVLDNKIVSFSNLLKSVFNKEFFANLLKVFVGSSIILFVLGNLMIYFERYSNIFHGDYMNKLFHSFWFIIVTIATVGYGDIIPHTFLGKLLTVIIIIFGIGIFGFYLSSINQILSTNKFKYKLNSYKDLKNKIIATFKHSSSHKMLNMIGVKKIIDIKSLEDGINLLRNKKIDAFVYDTFILRHHVKDNNEKDIHILQNAFGNRNYAFVIDEKQKELKEEINRSILRLKENGTYSFLYKKWFGDDYV